LDSNLGNASKNLQDVNKLNMAVEESKKIYTETETDMTDVNLVKVLEEKCEPKTIDLEDKYFKKIEELLSAKNKEMEDKLNQQQEYFMRQLNEINQAKSSSNEQINNGTKVSEFKQQLLDIKNYTLNKDKHNAATEMTNRSTSRSKKLSKQSDLKSDSLNNNISPNIITPNVEIKPNNPTTPNYLTKLDMDKLQNDQLDKETIQLSVRNDNFKDESPNLSAIINMDDNADDGSIEIERKRLSAKPNKTETDKIKKKSLAMKDIIAYKNSKAFKEDNHVDVVKQMQNRQNEINKML